MLMTNLEIFNKANTLAQLDLSQQVLPVKIGFFLQKNIVILVDLAKEIDNARFTIGKTYGELDAIQGVFIIPEEHQATVNAELTDLFAIQQDVNIHMFKLDEFDGLSLNGEALSALMFMIEE